MIALIVALTLSLSQVSCGGGEGVEAQTKVENQTDSINMDTAKILLTVGDRSFSATLADNSSARALAERLRQSPLSFAMDDYGDFEKVGDMGISLPQNDRQTTTGPGDIILYLGRRFVIYYDRNSWSFTRLGKVDGISTRAEMLSLLGGKGPITITLTIDNTER